MRNFLTKASIESIKQEGDEHKDLAYYTSSKHNFYLSPADNQFPSEHPRNRSVTSSKGCITTDQIPGHSDLHTLYNSSEFTDFLCSVLDEAKLFEYADPLSSVNLHYAEKGQELGWHFAPWPCCPPRDAAAVRSLRRRPPLSSACAAPRRAAPRDAAPPPHTAPRTHPGAHTAGHISSNNNKSRGR